jgi:hypothetical protein
MTTKDGDWAEGISASASRAAHNIVGDIPEIRNVVIQQRAREKRRFIRLSPRTRLKRTRDAAIGQAPGDAMAALQSLIADSDLRAYDTLRASKFWGRAYYMLGLPAAVLATIAGATGLATTAGRIPAAIIALIAAGLTTAATFLNSNENRQQSSKLSAAWQELADDVRLAVIQHTEAEKKREIAATSLGPIDIDDYNLIRDVVRFNKRKSALLRGDIPSGTDATQAEAQHAST